MALQAITFLTTMSRLRTIALLGMGGVLTVSSMVGQVAAVAPFGQGCGGCGHGFLSGAGQHGGRITGNHGDAAGPDGYLCGELLAELFQVAAAGGDAFHIQWPQDCDHAGIGWRDRGRVLWLTHRGHGISDIDQCRATGAGYGLSRNSCGRNRGIGVLWCRGGNREGGDILAPVAEGMTEVPG